MFADELFIVEDFRAEPVGLSQLWMNHYHGPNKENGAMERIEIVSSDSDSDLATLEEFSATDCWSRLKPKSYPFMNQGRLFLTEIISKDYFNNFKKF
ncbi:hypothetical protein Ciccas_007186 [Cichlidogyrus casuarinus]|uniref:Uncharacterized protein n=1 Tax=Cichlidogyrus casuarinus TaxID=1844966 RepID=A0ABD2Q668_9PLAT